jgi:hypothetical protein
MRNDPAEPMGRAGMTGNEVGSALIGARLVGGMMRLCFLMKKAYAPYPKWFGSAFKQLAGTQRSWSVLQGVLRSNTWQQKEHDLVKAYEQLAIRYNTLNLTEPFPAQTTSFFGCPFQIIAFHGSAEPY